MSSTHTIKVAAILTLLIASTACGGATEHEQEFETRRHTFVMDADEPNTDTRATSVAIKRLVVDTWTAAEGDDRCQPARRVLSTDEITDTRRRLLDRVRDEAFTHCGAERQAWVLVQQIEDVTFSEEAASTCRDELGEKVEVARSREVFGTTIRAEVSCGGVRPAHNVHLPQVEVPRPLPIEISTSDEPMECTHYDCCLALGGGEGYCAERYSDTSWRFDWLRD